jgi:transcription-repair coupling factor (superfamily II helicase)
VATVAEPGEYAVRGGLVDVWPGDANEPRRLDLFGSTVESIRSFDPLSQRSLGKADGLQLSPAGEVVFDPAAIARFKQGYLRQFGAVGGDPLFDAVAEGRPFAGMEHWLPLFHERLATLFDYLEPDCEIGFDHLAADAIAARAALIGDHYEARRAPPPAGSTFASAPYRPLPPHLLYLDEQSFARTIATRRAFHFSSYGVPPSTPRGFVAVEDLRAAPARDFTAERQRPDVNLFDAVAAHLQELARAPEPPILACWSEGSADRLRQILTDHGVAAFTPVTSRRAAAGAAGSVSYTHLTLPTKA